MAKSSPKTPDSTPDPAETGDAGGEQRLQVVVDDSTTAVMYANFCRVAMLPEELIVDFGLNMQALDGPQQSIKANQRVVLGYYSAKRLLGLLHAAVKRYETTFGVLEVDVHKRAQIAQGRLPS